MDQLSKEASNLFGLKHKAEDQSKVYNPKTQEYKHPEKRACLDGSICSATRKSDNWREIISKRQRTTKQYMSLLFYKLIVIIL